MMKNNALINIHMVSETAKFRNKPKYFFSSSVCIYRDMPVGAHVITEEYAYPSLPENEYGWEKLYSERMIQAFGRKFGIPIRIARFHTTYGPEANWEGGREKAADALCRKAAMAKEGTFIEVWGNGRAVRAFTYVDDLIKVILQLMKSNIITPTNIGSQEYVTVKQLAQTVIFVSGKNLKIKFVPGAVGVRSRNFSNKKIYSTGWRAKYSLRQGLAIHYQWVNQQVEKKYGKQK